MRLLFACELYHPSVGGVQEVLRQVAMRLVERGHEVTVATSRLEDLVARTNRAAPAKRALLVDLPRPEVVQAYLNSDLFAFASNIEYSP